MLRILLTLSMILSGTVMAQEDTTDTPKPPKLFEDDSVMEVTLTGPWRKLVRDKSSEDRHEGSLTYTDASGQERTISIGITTRGLTRRDIVCDFPPLKLWFNKDENKGTEFRGQSSLKMVTHCERNEKSEQLYIKEFLSYKIYNLITPFSFRVRQLQVTYQEADSNRKPDVFFGFLIEDVDDVADRHDMLELDIKEVEPTELHAEETANYAVFQYLIANLDWAATGGPAGEMCCHNGKLIGTSVDDRPVYVIPYDLDSSGLVGARYALPPEGLGVRRVTDRLYRGFCAHNAELPAALDRYRQQRQAIIDLFENNELLEDKVKRVAVKFLEEFYETLDSDKEIQEEFIDKCRG